MARQVFPKDTWVLSGVQEMDENGNFMSTVSQGHHTGNKDRF